MNPQPALYLNHLVGKFTDLDHLARLAIAATLAAGVLTGPTYHRFHPDKATVTMPSLSPRADAGDPSGASLQDSFRTLHTLAGDLLSPDGVALDTARGDLYITEEDMARVIRVTMAGGRRVVITSATPVCDSRSGQRQPGLRSPEGIAMTPGGTLLVAEDVPGGRLLTYSIDASGRVTRGDVVDIPMPGHGYAWESVAVDAQGRILLAGSSLESAASSEGPAAFEGVILYRDGKGDWWMPYRRFLASFSAVCFSPDSKEAFYACEVSGETGRFDLESQELRLRVSAHSFKSPEGLCALPDGSVLIAEESGRILRMDWRTEIIETLMVRSTAIESLLWNPATRQVIITADAAGQLLATEPLPSLALAIETPHPFKYESNAPPPFIPSECPAYLAKVLARVGFDAHAGSAGVSFAELARRLSLVAIDAQVNLISSDKPVEDPIDRVQFAVLSPNLLGVDLSGFTGPASGFAAKSRSGAMVHSELVEKRILQGNMLAGVAQFIGSTKIAVPFPSGARMAGDGLASIHFMGMGRTPDYSVVINAHDPGKSYMVVTDTSGHVQQYRLELPRGTDRNHWVVGLRKKSPDAWLRLVSTPAHVAGYTTRPVPAGS